MGGWVSLQAYGCKYDKPIIPFILRCWLGATSLLDTLPPRLYLEGRSGPEVPCPLQPNPQCMASYNGGLCFAPNAVRSPSFLLPVSMQHRQYDQATLSCPNWKLLYL